MTTVENNKCPNHICDGQIKIKYFSRDLDYKKINFSCTTDTYENLQFMNVLNVKLFSPNHFQMDKRQIEKTYQDIEDDKYISQIKLKKYYFEKLFNKISKFINKDMNVLEIGAYYGVLGSLKDKVKNTWFELAHSANYAKSNFKLNIMKQLKII